MNNGLELSDRALDAAVARAVFGLEVEEQPNVRTGERDFVCPELGTPWVRVPYSATSFSASLEVCDTLRQRGWNWWFPPIAGPMVEVPLTHENGRRVKAEGASAGEALCRAALKAVAPQNTDRPLSDLWA